MEAVQRDTEQSGLHLPNKLNSCSMANENLNKMSNHKLMLIQEVKNSPSLFINKKCPFWLR